MGIGFRKLGSGLLQHLMKAWLDYIFEGGDIWKLFFAEMVGKNRMRIREAFIGGGEGMWARLIKNNSTTTRCLRKQNSSIHISPDYSTSNMYGMYAMQLCIHVVFKYYVNVVFKYNVCLRCFTS